MTTIIAGGRDYRLTEEDFLWLDTIKPGISEVVCGGARGADTGGFNWGWSRGIPVKSFPADWKMYGKAAGFIRNCQMAKYAERVVLFPGGRGTAHMRQVAQQAGLIIIERASSPLPPPPSTP